MKTLMRRMFNPKKNEHFVEGEWNIDKSTEGDLRKQIQGLKNALMQQEELRGENKRLKQELKMQQDKNSELSEKLRLARVVSEKPTVAMLLAAAQALPKEEPTVLSKETGEWLQEKKRKPRVKK